MTKSEAEREVTGILDGWFGESIADAEDEEHKRRYLYDPLIKLARHLAKIEDDGTIAEEKK